MKKFSLMLFTALLVVQFVSADHTIVVKIW